MLEPLELALSKAPVTIVGIDCATNPQNVGLALASWCCGTTEVKAVRRASRRESPTDIVCDWISALEEPFLLAMDAPLGWPLGLGRALHGHNAGNDLSESAGSMFRRATDTFVKEQLGKQPLDVGSNLIARTAHSALGLLSELRQRTDEDISLAWSAELHTRISAIEVYPAATLLTCGIDAAGYKRKDNLAKRRSIAEQLTTMRHLSLSQTALNAAAKTDHELDAVLCVVAAIDFLCNKCFRPEDLPLAKREGWIWIAKNGRNPTILK